MDKRKKIPIVLVFIFPILVIAIFRDISNIDEMWNYMFADNISNGLLPYRDFNLLQTPFSCLVNALFIQIFGKHLLVIRLAGAVLFLLVSLLLYKICRYMGAGATEAALVPFGFLSMFYWDVFLEYNILILMFLLCGMLADIYACHFQMPLPLFQRHGKRKMKGVKSGKKGADGFILQHIFIGILMGFAILSKQTYGFFVAAGSCLSAMWIQPYLNRQKGDINVRTGMFKAFFLRIAGIAIPCSIFLFYLIFTKTLGNFFDMCLFGIKEFSGIYPYSSFMKENPGYFIGGVLFPLLTLACIIYMFGKTPGDKKVKMGILLLYALTGCISLYPLANSYHVALSAIPFLPALFLIFPVSLFAKKPIKVLKWTALAAAVIFLIFAVPFLNCKETVPCSLKHFELTFVKKESLIEIKQVHSYIEQKDREGVNVYILDNYAGLYFIPLDRYHNGLDMFLLGNLGTKPPKEWIREAEEAGDAVFLVPGEGRKNWQFPDKQLDEKKEEWEFVESISNFGVYRPLKK